MTGIIYCARNEVNLKSYIGQTVHLLASRKSKHLSDARRGSDTHFHNALRKHGQDTFSWRVLESDIPVERLGEREQHWIANTDAFHNGYNSTTGGEDGTKSEETKAKMSATQREKAARGENPMQNPEARAKKSATQKAKAARGEHPMQNPDIAKKQGTTHKANNAKNRRKAQTEAGQQFCIEMEKPE